MAQAAPDDADSDADPPALPDALTQRARRAADAVQAADGLLRVVTHYDADGLASAGVLAHTLRRAQTPFVLTVAKRLDADVVARAAEGDAALLVFADMGSGQADLFADAGVAGRTVVLDHHVPADGADDVGLAAHVNAHLGGVDGTYAACAATVCHLVAVTLDDGNWDLARLALAGVCGDRQERLGVAGLNAWVAYEAAARGVVARETALRLPAGPLGEGLARATDPFVLGLSGRPEQARAFLDDLELDPDAAWEDLDGEARRRLTSRLVAQLLAAGCRADLARELVGPRFTFAAPFRGVGDAGRLAELLNAAGRFDHIGDGLGFLLGQPDVAGRLENAARGYRDRVLEETLRVAEAGADVRRAVQVVEVERAALTGTVCGIAMNGFLDQDRATVALHREPGEDDVKLSARGTRRLVERGLDLAEACRVAAGKVGGNGGGHTIAAGATVPLDRLEAFLEAVDEVVAGQVGVGGPDGGEEAPGEDAP